ncbi:MAG: type II toxin-antitoxin system RelE/ParE family toxin [Proteobacteria bacterium]|nr:type II toxin-antitoxin system RelE/ParE family toxin [Pseudomonadota bacterium]
MKTYQVIWSENACYDLEEIIEYIKLDSLQIARNIFQQIQLRCNNLKHHPQKGRIVPELKSIGVSKYQEIIYKRWRIIYQIKQNSVNVLLLIDSSRNLEDILLQRLIR